MELRDISEKLRQERAQAAEAKAEAEEKAEVMSPLMGEAQKQGKNAAFIVDKLNDEYSFRGEGAYQRISTELDGLTSSGDAIKGWTIDKITECLYYMIARTLDLFLFQIEQKFFGKERVLRKSTEIAGIIIGLYRCIYEKRPVQDLTSCQFSLSPLFNNQSAKMLLQELNLRFDPSEGGGAAEVHADDVARSSATV
jgi:hypothetical protein